MVVVHWLNSYIGCVDCQITLCVACRRLIVASRGLLWICKLGVGMGWFAWFDCCFVTYLGVGIVCIAGTASFFGLNFRFAYAP